jgi:hypothetical protein
MLPLGHPSIQTLASPIRELAKEPHKEIRVVLTGQMEVNTVVKMVPM